VRFEVFTVVLMKIQSSGKRHSIYC